MSKTTETKKTKSKTPAPRAEVGPAMMGCEILVAALEREGVDTIFAYPGGASMEVHQALTRSRKIRTIRRGMSRADRSRQAAMRAPPGGRACA